MPLNLSRHAGPHSIYAAIMTSESLSLSKTYPSRVSSLRISRKLYISPLNTIMYLPFAYDMG